MSGAQADHPEFIIYMHGTSRELTSLQYANRLACSYKVSATLNLCLPARLFI